jgi:hypothetical protein
MKLTKKRLQKIINNNGKQTRKKYKKTTKILKHTNTARQKKKFNLKTNTLKNITI